jgi:isoleucyl-tRNA synthetase
MDQDQIAAFEEDQSFEIQAGGEAIRLNLEDVEIVSEDIPGWLVANEGTITVALDIGITEELRMEGIARELINRIQNIRKEKGFDVTDKIDVLIEKHELISDAVNTHAKYIGTQTLASNVSLSDHIENKHSKRIDMDDDVFINIRVTRV